MKNLIKILTAPPKPKSKVKSKHDTSARRKNIRLAYEIDGEWLCLTRTEWSRRLGIRYQTISNRQKAGMTNGQVLGFEKIPKAKSKGRPKNS